MKKKLKSDEKGTFKVVYDRKTGKDKRVYLNVWDCECCQRQFTQKVKYRRKLCQKCLKELKKK